MIRPIMQQGATHSPPVQGDHLAGFTLLELLVVLTIATLLMTQALPSMSAMLRSQRSISLGYAFLAALNLARNEAIKRNGRAVLCKSATTQGCTNSGGWEQGWILFYDANNNAALDSGDQVIEQSGSAWAGLRLTGNLPVANYVSYSASGSAKLISGAFQAGTFTLCLDPVSAPDVRQLVMSSTGRVRMIKGVAADACDSK